MHVRSHKVLRVDHIYKLFALPQLRELNAVSFTSRLLFIITLNIELRPSELYLHRLNQIGEGPYNSDRRLRGKDCLSSIDGTCQTAQKNWKDSRFKPGEVEIFDNDIVQKGCIISRLPVSVNCFAAAQTYLLHRRKIVMFVGYNERILVLVNHPAHRDKAQHQAGHIGVIKVSELIQSACKAGKIIGISKKELYGTHSLSKTKRQFSFKQERPNLLPWCVWSLSGWKLEKLPYSSKCT